MNSHARAQGLGPWVDQLQPGVPGSRTVNTSLRHSPASKSGLHYGEKGRGDPPGLHATFLHMQEVPRHQLVVRLDGLVGSEVVLLAGDLDVPETAGGVCRVVDVKAGEALEEFRQLVSVDPITCLFRVELEKADQAAIRSGATTAAAAVKTETETSAGSGSDPSGGNPSGPDVTKPSSTDTAPPPVTRPQVAKPPVRDADPPASDKPEGSKRKGKKGDG